MRFSPRILFILGIFFWACSSKTTTTPTLSGQYSEDLSVWRPKVEAPKDTTKVTGTTDQKKNPHQYVEPKFTVNEKLNMVLDSIDRININQKFVDGFTIQVYSGIKREDALTTKKQLGYSLPTLEADVQYVQPNFRVRAGKYLSRLEAQKDYMAVKRYFPNAIVIPDRIYIR
ncbi:MAG: SPOR domain-containing protein [Bacteroidota bacterium]